MAADRVLLVTNIFPPEIGGPATFIDRLAHALDREGREVTVVCRSDRASDPTDDARAFRVVRIAAGGRIPFRVRSRAVLAREMLRHRAVLVNGLEDQAMHAAELTGRAYVLKIVGDTVWENARNMGLTQLSVDAFQPAFRNHTLLRKIEARRESALRRARLVLTPSEYLKRMVAGWGVPPEKIEVVYNGVPLEDFAGYEPKERAFGPFEVAFSGRITNWKGVGTLLEAVAGMEETRVRVIGDGPELAAMRARAGELGMGERAVFSGSMPHEEMCRALSRAHVLVLVSEYEGLSHTLLEASALGLPCVTSERGGNPEVVKDGVNGLIVPYGDAVKLRAALERLRDNEELRLKLALAAKENSRRFDFAETVRRTAEFLLT